MKNILILNLILLSTLGCTEDFFEEDLSSKTVQIITPQNAYNSIIRVVNFKWEAIDDVTHYEIQIVSPSFSNIINYVVDSSISSTEFDYTFEPGSYEWRIKAVNFSSETPFTPKGVIQIDTSSNLMGQTVDLYTPLNNTFINEEFPVFTWLNYNIADNYDIEIRTGTNFMLGTLLESANTTTPSYIPTNALTEGTFSWGVRANNNTSSTAFFSNSFDVDLTVPGIPSNLSPDSQTYNTNDAINFSWTRAVDNGTNPSQLYDSLFIYEDALLTSLYKRVALSSNGYQDSIANVGDYYWQVKTFDAAGNQGNLTSGHLITIQ